MESLFYKNARTVRSSIGNNVILGEDTYVSDSEIRDNVHLNRRNIIEESIIDKYSYTGANTIIKKASIGKYCSISWNVSITGNIHDYNLISTHPFPFLSSFGFTNEKSIMENRRINIGNDVWIGANVCIMPGLTVADGAVIGGGTVVTRDIPPFAIAVGNPAKVIRYRFSENVIASLLNIRWWNFDESIIKDNLHLFKMALTDEVVLKLKKISKKE